MKEILINCGFVQKKGVILDSGEITDVLVEHSSVYGGVGNIYKGIVDNVVPGMQAAFINIGLDKNAFLFAGDIPNGNGEIADIRKLVKKGQDITVQITKEAQGVKGARVTANITVPGHKLVLMPQMDYIGVSKKIADPDEKERLKSLAEELRDGNHGFIVRTDAQGATREELKNEITYLEEEWRDIQTAAKVRNAPVMLHGEDGLLLTLIRDYFDDSFSQIVVNDRSAFEEAKKIASVMTPEIADRIVFSEGNLLKNMESKLNKLLQRKVWLDNGAYLVIDSTEALTAIDVNTGKFTGDYDLNKTIVKTNILAAKEIARQLRLRAIGGIIIIDFIDMETDEDRQQVLDALEEASRGDKIHTNILGFAPLGLVELTRKKTRLSLADSMQMTCPYCEGDGKILNVASVLDNLLAELNRSRGDYGVAVLRLNPYISAALRKYTEIYEQFSGIEVYIREDASLHVEDFNISMLDTLSDKEGLVKLI